MKNLKDVMFTEDYCKYVTKNSVKSSYTLEELYEMEILNLQEDTCLFCPIDKPCNKPWCPYTKEKK